MIVIALIIQPVSVPTDITFVSSVGSSTVLFIHVLLLYFIMSTLELQEMSGNDFQIDLGIALLNHGIGLDWDGDERPDYVRVGSLVPCNCNKCYFFHQWV